MGTAVIGKIEYESGYIITTDTSGNRRKQAIADVIRSADVPDVTISSLTLLTTCAQVVHQLLMTLVEKEVISEDLADGYDLQWALEKLIDDLAIDTH